MSLYIGKLIQDIIRPKTGNTSYETDASTGETTEGISNTLILSWINDALAFLQSRIISVYPGEFVEEYIQSTVAAQEAYDIDDNVFLKSKFISVEYSRDGSLENYFPLPPATIHERNTRSGEPFQYIRRNKQILLNYIPNSARGKIRTNYYRALDKLNIRRGTIDAKTLTTITLENDSYLDSFDISESTYLCIVDAAGAVQDYNIPISSYDSGTRVITIPSQTLVGVAGNYIVTGKYSTTHLPEDKPERMLDYCKVFAQARILNMDSSTDEINERQEVKDILADIVDQFSQMSDDIVDVPVIDEALAE